MDNPAILTGKGGLPFVHITAADGATADIYLHGAHVTSWTPVRGMEQLFVSEKAEFQTGKAIRGGVPVIFPQFAGMGPFPKHGFARNLPWELVDVLPGFASFRLTDNGHTRAIWPYAFLLEYSVEVLRERLEMTLHVTNTDNRYLSFTAALHTYLRVADIGAVSVTGLTDLDYRDSANGDVESVDESAQLTFSDEVDRIYFNTRKPFDLLRPDGRVRVRSEGFTDSVIWNPGIEKAVALTDLDSYRRFVCIEAAEVASPIRLQPGETWQGSQRLVATQN